MELITCFRGQDKVRRHCDSDDGFEKCASDSSSKTLYLVMGSATCMIDETTICLSFSLLSALLAVGLLLLIVWANLTGFSVY